MNNIKEEWEIKCETINSTNELMKDIMLKNNAEYEV